MATKQDKNRLITAARSLAGLLKLSNHGEMMRIRMPSRASKPETDGWRVVLGDLGQNQPRMELWLDRFSGYALPKFNACFFSENRAKLIRLVARVSPLLGPVRKFTTKDTTWGKYFALKNQLNRLEMAKPILEKYEGETFFGIYDAGTSAAEEGSARFLRSAAAFFIEVAGAQPKAKGRSMEREDFPRCENRKWVQAHLRRERSGYLASRRKELDGYRCQVCRNTFAGMYGEDLAAACVEAHHLKALGQQGDKVKTEINDLITVCANCHRVLHRMEGSTDDVKRLKTIVRNHR